MTILDCYISLKMVKKVVLGVVDMRQLLLNNQTLTTVRSVA